jgi:uncharacterized repeat protein (TIGR03803 family)
MGLAAEGGSTGNGTVFAVNTNGTGFTTLYSFSATNADGFNDDGAYPIGLSLSGSTLYGAASDGGSAGNGTVFAVNTNGTGFTNLYSFSAYDAFPPDSFMNNDGALPNDLILSGSTLYGTAYQGGSSEVGTVFSLSLESASLPPQLTITLSGNSVVLTWPTNATGFTLQSATNLILSAAWKTVSPAPVVISGQNTVTNAISGTQGFYRLSQ